MLDYEVINEDLKELKKAGWFIEIAAFKILVRAILLIAKELERTRKNLK